MKRLYLNLLDSLAHTFFTWAMRCDNEALRVRYSVREDFVAERKRESQREANKELN